MSAAVTVDVPQAFTGGARWAIDTLLSTCADPVAVSYPSSALPGSEAAWSVFADGGGAASSLRDGGTLDFGDGVEDLVASTFWHLSRWEERAGSPRDAHGRFPASAALADPQEPAVDTLAARFREAVGSAQRDSVFTVALTHDVDTPIRWSGPHALRGAVSRVRSAAIGGHSSDLAAELRGLAAAPGHRLRGSDPNWAFERIAEIERSHGGRSTYYVMAGHTHPADGPSGPAYDRARSAIVSQVLGQGDEVGLHPSYRSSGDERLLATEKRRLESFVGSAVPGARFHYLRHEAHRSLSQLDALGFVHDSSQGYAEAPGMRAGFSFPYCPYDLQADRPLGLVELPLVVMDATLAERRYLGLAAEDGLERAVRVLERAAEVGGTVAVLWHNDRFDPAYARGWDRVYDTLLRWVRERGGRLTTSSEAVTTLSRLPHADRSGSDPERPS